MAENQIPFEATLNDAGLTVGIEDIEQALRGLDEISVNLGQQMSEALTRAEQAMTALADSAEVASSALSPIAGILAGDASAAQESSATMAELTNILRDVGEAVSSIDGSLIDTSGALIDMGSAAGDVSAGMDSLIAQLRGVQEQIAALAEAAATGGAELNTFGARAKESGGETNVLAGNIGDFIAVMAGFTVVNDAFQGLKEFGNAAIYGNSMIERLQATLEALTGSKGAAQKIVDWSYAFGRSIPDTTTNLQQAIVTIASLGINVQQFMPSLATLAGVMGQTLPIAAQAFLDAFESDRFFMMQRRLRITKEELQQFGLELDKHGKIIQSTLVPAFEKLVAAKFPQGLSEIMGTLSGQVSNMIDQLQQLGMAFGKPIFEVFKQVLFGIIQYLNQNHDAIWGFANAVGSVLGGALQSVMPLLGDMVQFLQHNHAALAFLGALIMGPVIGAIVAVIGFVAGLAGEFTGLFAAATIVGAILSEVVAAFVGLYQNSAPLREALHTLWQAIKTLADAIETILLGALRDLLEPVKGLVGHLGNLFGHFKDAEGPVTMFGRASRTAAGAAHDFGAKLEYVRGPLSGVIDFIHGLADHITKLADAIKKGNLPSFTQVMDHVKQILQVVLPIAAAIGPVFLAVAGALKVFGFNAGSLHQFLTALHNIVQIVDHVFMSLFTRFLSIIDNLPTFGQFLGMLADAFNAVAVAILNGSVWTMITGAISAAAEAAGAFLAALLPVVAVVAAVALVVAGVVVAFMHWWQTSESFRKSIMGMLGLVASLGGVLLKSLKPAWDQIQSSIAQLKPVWDQLVTAFKQLQPLLIFVGSIIIGVVVVAFGLLFGVIKGVLMAIGPLIAGIIRMFTGLIQVVAGVVSFVVTLVAGIFNLIKDIFTGDGKSLAKDWDNLWHGLLNALGTILQGIGNLIGGFFGGLWGAISGFVVGVVTGIIDWFKNLADMLVGHSIIPDMILAIIQWFVSLPGKVIALITTMVTEVLAAIIGWKDMAIAFVENMVGSILAEAVHLELEVIRTINIMVQLAISAIRMWFNEGIALVASLVMGIIGRVESLVGQVVQFVWNMVNQFAAVFRGLIGTATGIASSVIGGIAGVIGGLAGKMAGWASDAVNGFIGAFGKLVGKVKDVAGNVAGAIAGFLHHSKPEEGPMADDDQWMPDFVETLARGIHANKGKLAKAASDAAMSMKQQITSSLNDTTLATQVTNRVAGQGGSVGPAALIKDNGKSNAGNVTINMTMPDSFAAGFALLDSESRRNLAKQLSDAMSDELARQTDRQMLVSSGYAGNSRN